MILIPTVDQNNRLMSTFEDSLKESNVRTSYLPDCLIVRYVSGNGK
jgi:hypothetical protein